MASVLQSDARWASQSVLSMRQVVAIWHSACAFALQKLATSGYGTGFFAAHAAGESQRRDPTLPRLQRLAEFACGLSSAAPLSTHPTAARAADANKAHGRRRRPSTLDRALPSFDNMLSVKAVQTSRLTRKESTELTRRRLIDGAIEILRRDGVAAATTGRIASAAGLKQPSFYVHFADRDQVFEAAAAEIGRRVIGILKRQLRAIDRAHPRRSIRATYAAMTTAFLSEPELTRIFLRHRIDDGTVLGRHFPAPPRPGAQ